MTATETADITIDIDYHQVPVDRIAPHPDNPRSRVGDLTELVRSIKAHGVLTPLLLLPADDNGIHLIVAGHRRHQAAIAAGLVTLPAAVRPLSPAAVIEAMLIENEQRADLTISEQIRAIERLMSLDTGLTPAKLTRRIGRSQAWVRTRMALIVLPSQWRQRLDTGTLTLASAEAATTAADLGPEHLEAVCQKLADANSWQDPARLVEAYRRNLDQAAAYQHALDAARSGHHPVYDTDTPPPKNTKRIDEIFLDTADLAAHENEPCHAITVTRPQWGQGIDTSAVCVNPKRHHPTKAPKTDRSDLTAHPALIPARSDSANKAERRKARLARAEHLANTLTKTRGGPTRDQLVTIALRSLIHHARHDDLKYAAAVLGVTPPAAIDLHQALRDHADTSPRALAQTAAALALSHAEPQLAWGMNNPASRDYFDLLTGTGWVPDDWTASQLKDTPTAHDEAPTNNDPADIDIDHDDAAAS